MNTLIAVTGIGVVAMLAEILNFRKVLLPLTLIGLLIALGLTVYDWDTNVRYFNDMMYFDNYAASFSGVMICTSIIWFLMNYNFLKNSSNQTDFTALIAFSLGGAIVMVSFADLIMLFLGIEILSIAMYILASSNKREPRSNEAGFKYFMMGAFASGILLFGMALVYGATGSFNLREISGYISANIENIPAIVYLGIIFLIVGLVFKVAAAPFHFWAPDVYEGAPTPFTAFMSTVVKTAAFAAFLRLFIICFSGLEDWWGPMIAIFSAASMLIGNIMAVAQTSLKRMLAYSSVAHAGYMLMVVVAMNQFSPGSLLIYTAAYSVASIGIFSLVMVMTVHSNEFVNSLKGFSKVNPFATFAITVIMLSMAGIPPVAGFFAKYYVFTGAVQSGYIWLVLIGVLSSLIGVYYYFRVIITMYQPADRESVQFTITQPHSLILGLILVLTLVLGIVPSILLNLI